MLVDDALDDAEAQAGAFTFGLGREEGLEDPRHHFVWDSGAVIDDTDHHTGSFTTPLHRRLDRDGTFTFQGMYGVLDQVGPDLVELVCVDGHPGKFAVTARHRYTTQLIVEDDEGRLDTLVK